MSGNHIRNRRGATVADDLCLRCFEFGHRRGCYCGNEPIVACGKCFRMNYFTMNCPCSRPSDVLDDQMSLRLVGGSAPRPFIDVMIGFTTYPALLNTGLVRTRINSLVLENINFFREQMELPLAVFPGLVRFNVRRRHREVELEMEIRPHQPCPIELGMDFMMAIGFSLNVDRVNLNQHSPRVAGFNTIDYIYNHSQGRQLRRWIRRYRGAMYHPYQRGNQPQLQEVPIINIPNNPPQVQPQAQPQPQLQVAENEDVLELHADENIEDLLNI